MRDRRLRGSYTVEAAIYVPIILFVLVQSLQIAIGFWQESKGREINRYLQELHIVEEFYNYQVMGEIMEEIEDD